MIDARKRALAKAISWRAIASIVLGLITWEFTGNLKSTALITVFYTLVQIFLYFQHERLWNHVSWGRTKGLFIQMTGMSGAGKTSISRAVAERLRRNGHKVELIDGDEYRKNVSRDLKFSQKDRLENIHRLGFIGRVLERNNVISILAAINPYESARKDLVDAGALTVYVRCSLDELKRRDPKGLYRRALLEDGHPEKVNNFTGISDPFEEPENPDIILDTENETLKQSADKLYHFILKKAS